jgi:2-polyprenyl-3-methyl-5-hydroxy-6-metoxy-1,4-benzoquinol methylase
MNSDGSSREVREIVSDAKALFSHGPIFPRTVQRLGAYVCPFHELLALVPKGASVLDVGCGSGIFLGLLMKQVGPRLALGFDASQYAIGIAENMRQNLPQAAANKIAFERRDVNQSWPAGRFDVVSIIDVMHHVSSDVQSKLFLDALDHVAPGGLLLYKDMADRPVILALANWLHDLIMARQWIRYVPIARIRSWGIQSGLSVEKESQCRVLWYAHEWILFKKPETVI